MKSGIRNPCPSKLAGRRQRSRMEFGIAVSIFVLLFSSCSGTQIRDGVAVNGIPSEVRRDLTVSGDIRVKGEVKVFSGVTLTVKPGTRFLFEPLDPDGDGVNDSRLVIEGVLAARGEPDAPIHFSSAASEPQPGDWLELRMDHSEGSVLEYCVLEHSRYGLHVHFSSGVVANSIIRNNIDGTRFGNSRFLVVNNKVSENTGKGINLRQSKIAIQANLIEQNRHGIFLFEEGGQTEISYNRFSANHQSDLRFGDFYEGPPPRVIGNGRGDGLPLSIAGPVEISAENEPEPPRLADAGPRTMSVTLTPAWQRDVGSMVDAHLVPVPGKDVVVVSTWGGELLQMDTNDGKVKVATRIEDVIDAAPVLLTARGKEGQKVLVFPSWDLKIRSVDAATGEVISELGWEPSNVDDHRQGAPIVLGSRIYLGLWNGGFGALDPDKMEWLWMRTLDGAVRSAPAYDRGDLWVGTEGGNLYSISPGGEIRRTIDLGTPVRTTPGVLARDDVAVVAADGVLTRISRGETRWRRKLPGVGTYASPVASNPDSILTGDGSGAVSRYDVDGALMWRTVLKSAVHMVAVQGPLVWAGTEDGRLAAISPVSGAVVATLESRAAVHSEPYLVGGGANRLIWASRDGSVRAHDLKLSRIPWEGASH